MGCAVSVPVVRAPEPEPSAVPAVLDETASASPVATSASVIELPDLRGCATLGSGAAGTVTLVCVEPVQPVSAVTLDAQFEQEIYALKTCRCVDLESTGLGVASAIRERNILASLAPLHLPFVIQLHNSYRTAAAIHLLTDAALGGELFSRIRGQVRLDVSVARWYAINVALALGGLHGRGGVVHRDLKPENILVDSAGYLVLADFGYATSLRNSKTYTLCGTPAYTAPEMITNSGYRFEVDWWAVGILLYEMVTGYTPFAANIPDPQATYHNILRAEATLFFPSQFSAPDGEYPVATARIRL